MNKKYQVFISSTYADLKTERKEVSNILLMADCIPAGMEAFAATDDEQFNVIKKVIDLCDYYILIIGNRYGSVNKATGKSFTEMEYDYAKSKGIPVLVFALENDDYPFDDDDQKKSKLLNFKDEAIKNRLASIWQDKTSLISSIAISIMKAKDELPRPGWIPSPQYDELSLLQDNRTLRKKFEEVETKNVELKKQLELFNQPETLAFEDEELEIEYQINIDGKHFHDKLQTKWVDIFKYLGICIINVSVPTSLITGYFKDFIRSKTHHSLVYLCDDITINTILNQFESLGLLSHRFLEGKGLYYGLTNKGKLLLDKLSLVKKGEYFGKKSS